MAVFFIYELNKLTQRHVLCKRAEQIIYFDRVHTGVKHIWKSCLGHVGRIVLFHWFNSMIYTVPTSYNRFVCKTLISLYLTHDKHLKRQIALSQAQNVLGSRAVMT